MPTSGSSRLSVWIILLSFVETAVCTAFPAAFPDTLSGSNGFGAFSIIRTDTSFSGTVCTGQVIVDGTYDADSVYLMRAQLGTSDFRTRIAYLPGDSVWSNATLLISSFCRNLIDISLNLQQQGTPLPSGEIELVESLLLGESDPVCESPFTKPFRIEFFSASLSGDFIVEAACMAIINPGTVTNLASTNIHDLGTLVSFSPPDITPTFQSSNFIIAGTVTLFGGVDADSVYLDGSIGRASLDALSLSTRSLVVESGDLSITEALSASKVGFGGLPQKFSVSGNSIVGARSIQTPKIFSSSSVVTSVGLVQADRLDLFGGSLNAGNFDVPIVFMTGGSVSVSGTTLVDTLTMSPGDFSGGQSMTAAKITGTGSTLGGTLIQVKQGPALIDLTGSQINAGTLDADHMLLNTCNVSAGTLLTEQTIANNSSFNAGLLNARVGRSLFFLNVGSVTSNHINAGTYDIRDVTTIAPFIEGDTLLTLRGSIHDQNEDSLRVQFLHGSLIDSTLVFSGMIYASLAQAEVTQGSRFESDRRGDGPRQEEIAFPGELLHRSTGASYGGYGGTNGSLNVNAFTPADDPAGFPDFSADEVRRGLGGFGWTDVQHSLGGVGGGRIRIDASSLVWSGYASVNGGDAQRPIPLGYNGGGGGGGGTGGTIHIDVAGQFSGNGRIESNGGNGAYSFGGDLSSQTGSGGSGGRIRINYGTLGLWTGTVKALGGVGGTFDTASIPYYDSFVTPWIDSLNHGGPGTIYWKQIGGNGRILVDGVGGPGGVGRVDGNYPADTLEVHGALVVTNRLTIGGLKLTNGGVLRADNPRVRLRWPPPPAYGISELFSNPGLYTATQAIYPTRVWQDSLRERLTVNVAHDIVVDGTSRFDMTGQGGYGQADYDFANGAYGNRAGGSYGGYGGWGRWGSEHQMGRPNAVYGDPLSPEEVGEGGYGVVQYTNTPHGVTILGGAGGGALRLIAGGSVHVDGKIVSDGGRGKEDTPAADGQGTGGGAGGSIWITASSLSGAGVVSASGGDGSFDEYYELWGGGGGGGRIRFDVGGKASWTGAVMAIGGRGGQHDTSHHSAISWTNPRMHGGAGTVYWNEPSSPSLVIRNFAADSGTSALSGAFPGFALTVQKALVASNGLAVGSLTLADHAILSGDDNRTTLYSFPGNFSVPSRFPLWTPKLPVLLAVDVAENVSIDGTSRIDLSGLGGFSQEDYNSLAGAALNPAGGSHGGVGGTGKVASLFGVSASAYGDSARPMLAGAGGFGEEAVTYSVYDQCGSGGPGGGGLRMSVGGMLTIDGAIRALGFAGTPESVCAPSGGRLGGGGAGGSVFIAASQFLGSGLIDASGGGGAYQASTGNQWSGGGGGGRIALYGNLTGFLGQKRAFGGLGGAGNGADSLLYKGEDGSIVVGSAGPDSLTAFLILNASVSDGDTGVSRIDPIRLVLNKPASAATLILSSSPDPGGWRGTVHYTGDTLFIEHAPLAEQTTYTLRIVQLRSMFGDTLGAGSAKQWRFSTGGTITGVDDKEQVPLTFALEQNYPNPFNPETRIRYQIPEVSGQMSVVVGQTTNKSDVRLSVFDLLGREVAVLVREEKSPGTYTATWNAAAMPSGVYFYRLAAGDFTETRKMVLAK